MESEVEEGEIIEDDDNRRSQGQTTSSAISSRRSSWIKRTALSTGHNRGSRYFTYTFESKQTRKPGNNYSPRKTSSALNEHRNSTSISRNLRRRNESSNAFSKRSQSSNVKRIHEDRKRGRRHQSSKSKSRSQDRSATKRLSSSNDIEYPENSKSINNVPAADSRASEIETVVDSEPNIITIEENSLEAVRLQKGASSVSQSNYPLEGDSTATIRKEVKTGSNDNASDDTSSIASLEYHRRTPELIVIDSTSGSSSEDDKEVDNDMSYEELELRKVALEGLVLKLQVDEGNPQVPNGITNMVAEDQIDQDDELMRAELLLDMANKTRSSSVALNRNNASNAVAQFFALGSVSTPNHARAPEMEVENLVPPPLPPVQGSLGISSGPLQFPPNISTHNSYNSVPSLPSSSNSMRFSSSLFPVSTTALSPIPLKPGDLDYSNTVSPVAFRTMQPQNLPGAASVPPPQLTSSNHVSVHTQKASSPGRTNLYSSSLNLPAVSKPTLLTQTVTYSPTAASILPQNSVIVVLTTASAMSNVHTGLVNSISNSSIPTPCTTTSSYVSSTSHYIRQVMHKPVAENQENLSVVTNTMYGGIQRTIINTQALKKATSRKFKSSKVSNVHNLKITVSNPPKTFQPIVIAVGNESSSEEEDNRRGSGKRAVVEKRQGTVKRRKEDATVENQKRKSLLPDNFEASLECLLKSARQKAEKEKPMQVIMKDSFTTGSSQTLCQPTVTAPKSKSSVIQPKSQSSVAQPKSQSSVTQPKSQSSVTQPKKQPSATNKLPATVVQPPKKSTVGTCLLQTVVTLSNQNQLDQGVATQTQESESLLVKKTVPVVPRVNIAKEKRELELREKLLRATLLKTMESSQCRLKLATSEKQLMTARQSTIDMFSNLLQTMKQYTEKRQESRELEGVAKSLEEQLISVQSRVLCGKKAIAVIGEDMRQSSDGAFNMRKKYLALSKACRALGEEVSGKEYKVPVRGVMELHYKMEEVRRQSCVVRQKPISSIPSFPANTNTTSLPLNRGVPQKKTMASATSVTRISSAATAAAARVKKSALSNLGKKSPAKNCPPKRDVSKQNELLQSNGFTKHSRDDNYEDEVMVPSEFVYRDVIYFAETKENDIISYESVPKVYTKYENPLFWMVSSEESLIRSKKIGLAIPKIDPTRTVCDKDLNGFCDIEECVLQHLYCPGRKSSSK